MSLYQSTGLIEEVLFLKHFVRAFVPLFLVHVRRTFSDHTGPIFVLFRYSADAVLRECCVSARAAPGVERPLLRLGVRPLSAGGPEQLELHGRGT